VILLSLIILPKDPENPYQIQYLPEEQLLSESKIFLVGQTRAGTYFLIGAGFFYKRFGAYVKSHKRIANMYVDKESPADYWAEGRCDYFLELN